MPMPKGGLPMFLSSSDITHRVARRYLKSRSDTDPHDHARVWTIPTPFSGIPDDLVIQHSDGCVVTTEDVEESISQTMNIIKGSCQFHEVHARDETNGARFTVLTESGKRVRGIITVNVVASAHELTAYSIIELDLDSG